MHYLAFMLPLSLYSGIAAQLISLSLFAILLPCLFIDYKYLNYNWLFVAIILLIIWFIFPFFNLTHLILSPATEIPFKKYLSSHIPSSMIITAIGIFLLFIKQSVTKKKYNFYNNNIFDYFILGVLVASIIYFIYGSIQHIYGIDFKPPYLLKEENTLANGRYRIFLFLGHPLTVASIALAVFLFFSYLIINHKAKLYLNYKNKITITIIIICNFLILIMSGGRTATAVGTIMFTYLLIRNINIKYIYRYIAIFIFLFSLLYLSSAYNRIYELLFNIFDYDELQHEPRFIFLKTHYKMFMDSPILGHSSVRVKYYLTEKYYDLLDMKNYFRKYSAHNIFMQTLVEVGLLGFFGIIICCNKIYKKLKTITHKSSLKTTIFLQALCFSIIANILHGISQNTFFDSSLVTVYCVLFWILFWQTTLEQTYKQR